MTMSAGRSSARDSGTIWHACRSRPTQTRASRPADAVIAEISGVSGESSDGFELFQRASARCGGRDRKEIPDIEQDLQHQLVAHICAVEVDHPGLIRGLLGAIVGFAVDRFEIGENAFP